MSEQPQPFVTLGIHLKFLREQLQESLAEVSGAVEIDEQQLARIEAGHERPAEDILMLLINHFDMADQEAIQLWELAGYEGEIPVQTIGDDGHPSTKPVVVVLAVDARTMYTDGVEINNGSAGITLHFTQSNGKKLPLPVARLGMSYDQATAVLDQLQQALLRGKYQGGPKSLPPTT